MKSEMAIKNSLKIFYHFKRKPIKLEQNKFIIQQSKMLPADKTFTFLPLLSCKTLKQTLITVSFPN